MSRGATRQISNIEDQDGNFQFQERSEFPYNWFKPARIVYWACDISYDDLSHAKRAKKEFGATEIQEGFYDEPDAPTWFLIFDDADKCAAFMAAKRGYEWEWLGGDKEKSHEPEEAVA